MSDFSAKHPTLWGYAGVFPGEFRIWDGDPLLNKLRFMAEQGFGCTGIGLEALREPVRRREISAAFQDYGLAATLHFHAPFFTGSPETLHEHVARYVTELDGIRETMNVALVVINAGPFHRFMREPSLAFQLERLELALKPLAAACVERSIPLGIENHVDYFASDLIALCDRVPGLGIFFDTGNTVQLGEKPLDAARVAAPFVVGTHFKDFRIEPDERTLSLRCVGATFGEGDIDLEAVYRALIEGSPHPERLVMEFELIPPPNSDPWESLDRSKRFVERIAGYPSFKYPTRS